MSMAFNIVCFFAYAFIGYVFECCVLSIQYRKRVINRGFVHGPFCVIYGVGAMAAVRFLAPYSGSMIAVFVMSTTLATTMEIVTAWLMIKLFGQVWWDYSDMKFNYKGIVSLESSIAWGFLGLFFFAHLSKVVTEIVAMIPEEMLTIIACLLTFFYILDFLLSSMGRIKQYESDDKNADDTTGILRIKNKRR